MPARTARAKQSHQTCKSTAWNACVAWLCEPLQRTSEHFGVFKAERERPHGHDLRARSARETSCHDVACLHIRPKR